MASNLAVITGASGGIGRAFAFRLAGQHFDLLLSGRNEPVLNELADEIRSTHDVNVIVWPLDLLDESKLKKFAEYLKKTARPGMLVCCAGFGAPGEFWKSEVESQLDMVRVQITAPLQLLHAVMPSMIKRRSGSVIVVSSLAAFFPAPQSSLYAGTKSFLRSFMESIHMEVHRFGINVQCLCPGFTRTAFHKKSFRLKPLSRYSFLWMNTDEVVETSLSQLKSGKVICVPGFTNRLIKWLIQSVNRGVFYALTERFYKRHISANA